MIYLGMDGVLDLGMLENPYPAWDELGKGECSRLIESDSSLEGSTKC